MFIDDNHFSDPCAAYNALVSEKDKNSKDVEFMSKLAKTTYEYGVILRNQGAVDLAKKLFSDASLYGEEAVEIDNKNGEAHKWYSVALSAIRDYNSIEDKIFKGHMIKMHCDQAMEVMPDDAILVHLQGRWRYEISMFTTEENNLAARMFCIPPYSTLEESETILSKANQLKPDWKENILYLAKTYIAMQKFDEAMKLITTGVALPVKSEFDTLPHQNLLTLQKKLQSQINE